MNKMGRTAALLVWASSCLALGGCAATQEAAAPVAGRERLAPGASDAEQVALALADAERAQANGERSRLARALARLEALGARPLDEPAADPAAERRRAGSGAVPPMRGRPLGPGYRSGRLAPGASEHIEQVFLSGERASIALSALSETGLKLQVHDRRAAQVCGRAGTPSHCRWVPTFTERYRIKVENPGSRPARYFLVIE
jgi:hypothetical protein